MRVRSLALSKTLERHFIQLTQSLGVRNDLEKKEETLYTGCREGELRMVMHQFLTESEKLKEEEGRVDSCLLCCAFNNI